MTFPPSDSMPLQECRNGPHQQTKNDSNYGAVLPYDEEPRPHQFLRIAQTRVIFSHLSSSVQFNTAAVSTKNQSIFWLGRFRFTQTTAPSEAPICS